MNHNRFFEKTPKIILGEIRPHGLANEAFLEMTGYSGDDVIGRNCRFLQGADTDPAIVEKVREAIRDGQEITVEILKYHRDDRPFWNQLLISPVFDDGGDIRFFFASQIDVTARRAAQDLEAAEHLLLKEVDHRAKNALAFVQSIMRLTRTEDAKAYAHIVQGRVDALARAHALLAEGRWRGVAIAQLIRGEVAPFGSSVSTQMGQRYRLPLRRCSRFRCSSTRCWRMRRAMGPCPARKAWSIWTGR